MSSSTEISEQKDAKKVPRKDFFYRASRLLFSVAGIFVVVLAITLFIARPTGDTRFSVLADNPPDWLTVSLFPNAEASIGSAFDAHADLSSQIAGRAIAPLPKSRITDEPSEFRAIVESLGLELEIEDETGRVVSKLNLVEFFETLYEALGYTDYFITVTSIEPTDCVDTTSDEPCYRMNVRYQPPLISAETIVGKKGTLADNLAVYVMRGIVKKHGDAWRAENASNKAAVPPFLLAASIPNSMDRLTAVSEGLKIVSGGCGETSTMPLACVEQARERLKKARTTLGEAGQGGALVLTPPPAAFGLAVLELDAAIHLARHGSAPVDIEKRLGAMEGYMRDARSSRFLMDAVNRRRLEDFEHLFGDARIDPQLLAGVEGADFSCALSHHRRALWDGCLKRTERVDLLPAAIRPYFEAARFDAKLYQAGSNGAAVDAMLVDLRTTIEASGSGVAASTNWPLRFVEFRHLCRRGQTDPQVLYQRADQLLRSIRPSHRRKLVDLHIHECEQPVGGSGQDTLLAEVQAYFEGEPDSYEKRVLYLEIARYHAMRGDRDRAVAAAENAVRLPWLIEVLGEHPDFGIIAGDRPSMRRLMDAVDRARVYDDLEVCSDWRSRQ